MAEVFLYGALGSIWVTALLGFISFLSSKSTKWVDTTAGISLMLGFVSLLVWVILA